MRMKHTCSVTAILHKECSVMLEEQAEGKKKNHKSCGPTVILLLGQESGGPQKCFHGSQWDCFWEKLHVGTDLQCHPKVNLDNKHKNAGRITTGRINSPSVFLGIHGSSFLLDIKDFLLKTSLKERTRSLIGPFCCSVSVEAKWCKHSGDPGPEQSIPKIYIDLRGGLLQVCMRCLWFWYWTRLALDDWDFTNKLHGSLESR